MARASSKDVARQAGVSIATVSHVINGTRFVSDETRQKVLDAIDALNYRPNAVARGLATNSTRKIGLVISEITNPFFTAAARGIEDESSIIGTVLSFATPMKTRNAKKMAYICWQRSKSTV